MISIDYLEKIANVKLATPSSWHDFRRDAEWEYEQSNPGFRDKKFNKVVNPDIYKSMDNIDTFDRTILLPQKAKYEKIKNKINAPLETNDVQDKALIGLGVASALGGSVLANKKPLLGLGLATLGGFGSLGGILYRHKDEQNKTREDFKNTEKELNTLNIKRQNLVDAHNRLIDKYVKEYPVLKYRYY